MLKININSIRFKIYFLFIISNLIAFSIGILLTVNNLNFYGRLYLREKLYMPLFFFICIAFYLVLIFTLINRKFSGLFSNLLKSIKAIDPNNPKKLNIISQYEKKEIEFYEFAKAVTALNDAIMEKHEENNLIVSNINYFSKIISGQDDFGALVDKLISLIVERMGYSHAWFGVLDENSKEVKVINAYNNDFNYSKNIILKYDDSINSQNLASRAIKAKNYEVINDVENDGTILPYKNRLLKFKFSSLGVFPLVAQGNVIGILAIYSNKKDAFDDVKAGAIFNLTNYVSYLSIYLKNLKRSMILSEIAEQILFLMAAGREKEPAPADIDNKEFLNNLEDNLQTDFVEFIVFDGIKNEIAEAKFSKGWDYNLGESTISPLPTLFVQKRIAENRLDAYNYQEDEFATEFFKKMDVRDIILYAFEGTGGRRYLAVTGVIKKRMTFHKEDLDFFRDGVNLFATYFEISMLFNKLDSSLRLLENRENLINKMADFGVVSINLTNESVRLYNDYFAGIFDIEKFSGSISVYEFYENIKPSFEDENYAYNIFEKYIKNRYMPTIEGVEINLKNGLVLSMKSSIFLTKNNDIIRVLVFANITDSKNYIKNMEGLNKKLNLINELSYKLSTVFTLEYAIKTFAEGLYLINHENSEGVNFLHINIFDTVDKKTVTSLIYAKNTGEADEQEGAGQGRTEGYDQSDSDSLPGKVIITTSNINYEDYLSNCKLLKNGRNKDITVRDCEFRGTDGSYTCFPLKISDEVAGTISVDSRDVNFFDVETVELIKEIINIASPVFAKLILIETSKELAVTDALTGIYNRRYMYEFAKREIARAYRNAAGLSFAILDIDKFKSINDNYGHQIGDEMLIRFTSELKNVLMRKQDIITRYGGDEFVVILPDTDKQNAVALMEKLRKYFIEKIYNFENNINISVSISVGVSSVEKSLDSALIVNNGASEDILNYLLKTADDNLYRAKEMGRNRVIG